MSSQNWGFIANFGKGFYFDIGTNPIEIRHDRSMPNTNAPFGMELLIV